MSIQLTTVAGTNGTWQVFSDGTRLGTWQRTDAGAVLSDTAGECVAVISAVTAHSRGHLLAYIRLTVTAR